MPAPSHSEPIDRRSAREVVFERLRTWIEEGLLAPGELIKDGDLAQHLGVSRTPVREALQLLQQHGLVEMQPGRLTRVTETTIEDVAKVYAPLSALEALAAELGTPHATAVDIEEMETHNARLLAAIDGKAPTEARDADRAFHLVLVRLADNPYLATAIEPMLTHIRRLEARYFQDEKPGQQSHREHERIIAAVRAGDAEAARDLTRTNFQRYVGSGA
jgi:DNA-binding GntR family transcriptional regulator